MIKMYSRNKNSNGMVQKGLEERNEWLSSHLMHGLLRSVDYCPQGDCSCMSVTVAQPAVPITRDCSVHRWHPHSLFSLLQPCLYQLSSPSPWAPAFMWSVVAGQVRHLMVVLEWWITSLFSDWVTYRLQHYGPVPFQPKQRASCQ